MKRRTGTKRKRLLALAMGMTAAVTGVGLGTSVATVDAVTATSAPGNVGGPCPQYACGANSNQVLL
jgi:hypothetical protein